MTDIFFKLKILYNFLIQAYDVWRIDVWNKDLDARHCCDGKECCCEGITNRELFSGWGKFK